MANIGKFNTLRVVKSVDFGVYLDGGDLEEILLPTRYLPKKCNPGDMVDVFLYLDSEDRLVATTQKPYAVVGDVALLKVIAVTPVGAFLDWGLPKDLLVPYSEQKTPMKDGQSYLVSVFLDKSRLRIAASSRLENFFTSKGTGFEDEQEVALIIGEQTDIGFKAIINNTALGLLYNTEIFQPLQLGQKVQGYIKKVRDDGKIDLCLQKPGYDNVTEVSRKILEAMEAKGGFLHVTDKSPADQINRMFGVSKKTYKKAIGALYKSRRIFLEKDGIALSKKKE